ncbi:AraC family transcriptional regulator [Achromobacter sp. Marseille-Q4962]|nr:AraC family transcriptional regulator [Achromobacter sp. Marseille-Q4962]
MTHHTIAIGHLAQILHGARSRGVDVNHVLERAEVSPALLQSPMARVSQAQFARILRRLRLATRDDFMGLGTRPVPLGAFALACGVAQREPCIGRALRAAFRLYHGLLPDFTARLCVSDGLARIVLDTRAAPGPARWYGERTFLFFTLGVANWLAARRIPILGVDYRNGERSADAHRLFYAPVRYGQPETGLRLQARWLDLPVVQDARSLREFLANAPFDLLVKFQDRTTLTERIRRLLRNDLSGELPSLARISAQLAMTPQTLRRRLREEGQGFQALKDDLRRDAAIEYLGRPELSLVDIAERLGFSECSTFNRAFKKWTGVAPGEYRRSRMRNPQPDAHDTFRQCV